MIERGPLSDETVARSISLHFVPVKVDGRRANELRREPGFEWPGDLVVVSPNRAVIHRFGSRATPEQVALVLAGVASPEDPDSSIPEPDIAALAESLLSPDPAVVRSAHDRLAQILGDVPPFDRTGLPEPDERLVRLLGAWWDVYRDSLSWRPDRGRYEFEDDEWKKRGRDEE